MKKDELIKEVALKTHLSLKDAKSAIDATFTTICEQIENGEEVVYSGFGTFTSKKTKERVSRNPKTGEPVQVKASCKPVFKAGKLLKEAAKKNG